MTKIKSFSHYQKEIEQFAIYPHIGPFGLMYPILGFIDELGEFEENPTLAELGDVYWYAARMLSHINGTFDAEIARYIYDRFDFILKDIKLEFSKATAALKKYLRDDNDQKLTVFEYKIESIIYKLHILGHLLGFTPLEVMQYNFDKLMDRKKRNVIKGDGDNR